MNFVLFYTYIWNTNQQTEIDSDGTIPKQN